jgi:uncharacterized protein (DUF1330 family)
MKKGYWVVAYRTMGDEATMKNYVTLAVAALGKFGARTLAPFLHFLGHATDRIEKPNGENMQ